MIRFDRSNAEYLAYELNRFMYNATEGNAVEELKKCLRGFGGELPWNSVTPEGLTLLHTTASYDSLNSVKTLITLGMNPNTQDQDGNTFVHHAFDLLGIVDYGGHSCKVVKWMAENGFDLNVKNKFGQTPLFLLGRYLDKLIEDECIPKDATDLSKEMIVNLVEQFEILGGDFYHKDYEGRTFVDVFPVHPELVEFGLLREQWRAKLERHNIEQEVRKASPSLNPKGRKI